MNDTTRTVVFCGVAVVAVMGAFAANRISQPLQLEGYERVGEQFFPEFTDPTAAKGLRVAVYNPDSAEVRMFSVENKNGAWTIPSRHNYPADGEERLAKTATSVIGITRGALESRRPADHERLGVIDPLNEESTALKGRGKRLTILGDGNEPLADYIIGNAVDGKTDEYYVRNADEDDVYRTRLSIDLSTKFADWIEADLLKLERDKLSDIVIRKYSIDEGQMALKGMEISELSREKPGEPWKLAGLDEATEEVNTEAVNTLIGILDDLKIVGVRPKPTGLSKNLKISEELKLDPLTAIDLQSKGFIVARDQNGNQVFVADEGELLAYTNQGVAYHLYFGEIATGTDVEIELGKSPEENAKEVEELSVNEAQSADDQQGQNRYLFVTAAFDESLLGPEPQEPVKPSKPSTDEPAAETEAETEATSSDTEAQEDATKETPSEAADKSQPDETKPTAEQLEAEYQAVVAKYEADLAQYKRDREQRQEKIKQGKELVAELNARFADWYYVISASSFEKLRLSREAFVKPKSAEDEDSAAGDPQANPEPPIPQPTTSPGEDEPTSEPEPSDEPSAEPTDAPKSDPKEESESPTDAETDSATENEPAREETTPP